jgi:hypothetical protein
MLGFQDENVKKLNHLKRDQCQPDPDEDVKEPLEENRLRTRIFRKKDSMRKRLRNLSAKLSYDDLERNSMKPIKSVMAVSSYTEFIVINHLIGW